MDVTEERDDAGSRPMTDGAKAKSGAVPAARDDSLLRDDLITDRALTEKDPDRLDHGPIARRVLDLVTVSDPPVNVALFGAWGAGKSSFATLLQREITDRELDIRIVNYNAWTFTGESLQRNFISHAARALGVDPKTKEGRLYHQGLYETIHSSGLNLGKWDWVRMLGLTVAILGGIVGVLSLIVVIVAVLTNQDPLVAVQNTIPSVIASSAVSALLLAGVKQILDGARIESDRSAPTQEQLHSTFLDLVEDQTKPLALATTRRRILFFIDELDRCPQEQVVATLAAIRNYFEAPGCIFVVAADRQVLERAFAALPWPNPGDDQNPYYGSASEFFDKIFQYQVPLPPLRGPSLLRLANDLVVDKSGGIWADLRKQNEGHLLGLVLYTLIPSHVRSPRRVKVLLNSFATNARVASSRGLDWQTRAQEIAKLTALQTEFPLFANDLIVEPRLPSYLLDPASAPESRAELVEKHRLDPERVPVLTPAAPEPEPAAVPAAVPEPARVRRGAVEVVVPSPTVDASVLIATDPTPRATRAQADVLKIAQRRLLRAYLVRVQDVADPSRDLLYLSSAGQAFDLQDPELAAIIEERAVDDPTAVIAAAARKTDPATRQGAIRLLAGQIMQGFGQERVNLVTAMVGIAEGLDYDLGPAADEATSALSAVAKQEPLGEDLLVPALNIALAASPIVRQPLEKRLLDDPRLLGNQARLAGAAAVADRLPATSRKAIWARLAASLPSDHEVLDPSLTKLPTSAALELLDAARTAILLEASEKAAAPDQAPAFVADRFSTIRQRKVDADVVGGRLLVILTDEDVTATYASLNEVAPDLIGSLDALDAEDVCLMLVACGPPEDWATWAGRIPQREPDDESSGAASVAAASIFTETDGVEKVDLEAVAKSLVPSLARLDLSALWTDLKEAIDTAIAARPWAPNSHVEQAKLYRAILALRSLGDPITAGIDALVSDNLILGLEPSTASVGHAALVRVGGVLPKTIIETVGPVAISAASAAGGGEALKVRAQVQMATRMARLGDHDGAASLMPSRDAVLEVYDQQSVLAEWLRMPPPPEQVRWMAAQITAAKKPGSVDKVTATLFVEWARASATAEDRTGLLLDVLAEADDITRWIEAVAPQGVDEAAIVDAIVERANVATTAARRGEFVDDLDALRPTDARGQQKIAAFMVSLLERGTSADFDLSGRLIRAVGTKHKSAGQITVALEKAADAGRTFSGKRLEELRSAGIVTKKKASLFGRLSRPRKR